MKSLYNFIIKPLNERYDNNIKVGDKNLIVNTCIEDFKFISREAEVVALPSAFSTIIKVGDKVIVHHNIFRRWHDQRGNERNSAKYFTDNLYFAETDQIYLYKRNNKWEAFNDRCFVIPLKNDDQFKTSKTKDLIGILKIGNSSLEALGITPGDVIGFKPKREWEFKIENELLYCMKSNDIVIKYECKENQTEYNPSWASSS
tara:strand:+ start:606 stop:1211 length:606 start_codon:yes stop_codon:yes gene_type:complete